MAKSSDCSSFIQKYEDADELKQRSELVLEIEQILAEWVQQQGNIQGDSICTKSLGRFMAYGGQALGVVQKGGDIDGVSLVPSFIRQSQFFQKFPVHMKENGCCGIRTVEGAHCPVVQFTYKDIEFDMSLCILNQDRIPDPLDLQCTEILENLDIGSIRAINGCRNTSTILSLVPNKDIFTQALMTIKLWAKNHHIYKSSMGYPGGAAWTVMVAYICIQHPCSILEDTIVQFFSVFSKWNWSKPVLLLEENHEDPYKLKPWCTKNASDRQHIMPVVLPAYPSQNAAFVVSKSNLEIIESHFKQADTLLDSISNMNDGLNALVHPWGGFFQEYKHFLVLKATSGSENHYSDWIGYVESQARKLCLLLDDHPNIEKERLYTHRYQTNSTCASWYVGLKLNKGKLSLASDIEKFRKSLLSEAIDRNVFEKGDDFTVQYINKTKNPTAFPPEAGTT